MNSQYISIIKQLSQKRLVPEEVSRILIRGTKIVGPIRKSEILKFFQESISEGSLALTKKQEENFLLNCRMKSVRTLSGVTTVTVLTAPYYCPGQCIFCPSDVRLPKSYLPNEPGAQRALDNNFDPFKQVFNRIKALENIGHPIDKIELIVLGGTWSVYPRQYQIWFIKRCFQAMNTYRDKRNETSHSESIQPKYTRNNLSSVFEKLTVSDLWKGLKIEHIKNEKSKCRCVGLSIETRPDEINIKEVINLRKLGTTKVQLGIQSLNDLVLEQNKRGHDVRASVRAVELLRQAGFKIQIHWMANLLGSSPSLDILDYKKLFRKASIYPDEIKIYPCSLIRNSPLYQYYLERKWRPYTRDELKQVVTECIKNTPRWCRLSRVFRDIPSNYIEVGEKATNFRQIAEAELKLNTGAIKDIRYREIRGGIPEIIKLKKTKYVTSISTEYFLEYVTPEDKICGFLRLSLPRNPSYIKELNNSALIREVHVYGQSIGIDESPDSAVQHSGLGRKLVFAAHEISKREGFNTISVISAIGTREYYRKLGYELGSLYMSYHMK